MKKWLLVGAALSASGTVLGEESDWQTKDRYNEWGEVTGRQVESVLARPMQVLQPPHWDYRVQLVVLCHNETLWVKLKDAEGNLLPEEITLPLMANDFGRMHIRADSGEPEWEIYNGASSQSNMWFYAGQDIFRQAVDSVSVSMTWAEVKYRGEPVVGNRVAFTWSMAGYKEAFERCEG